MDRLNICSVVVLFGFIGGIINNGFGKGLGKNKKVKGLMKRVNVLNKRKQDDVFVFKK